MGAEQSRHGARGKSGTAPKDDAAQQEDLYEILQVSFDATGDEIKRSYRKLSLIHHPDKNFGDVEAATQRFAKIQQAYEARLQLDAQWALVLSDEDERAFYDSHRDDLLNDDEDIDDFDPRSFRASATPAAPPRRPTAGLTTKHLLKFFQPSLWSDFSDSPSGFHGLFGALFAQLAAEETSAAAFTGKVAPAYPGFGPSTASYDENVGSTPAAKGFYAAWIGFATCKTFTWIEPYPLPPSAAGSTDRRIRRLAERENARARDEARREYDATIRSLIGYVKKRDPRWKKSPMSDPEGFRKREAERIKRELREVQEKRAKEREQQAKQWREQAWQRQRPTDLSDDNSDASDDDADSDVGEDDAESAEEEEEEEEEINDWYCAACSKAFNSQGAWDNHERSKKHKQNALRLRKELLAEEATLPGSVAPAPPRSDTSSPPLPPPAAPKTGADLHAERQALAARGRSVGEEDDDLALQMAVQESMDGLDLDLKDEDERQADVGTTPPGRNGLIEDEEVGEQPEGLVRPRAGKKGRRKAAPSVPTEVLQALDEESEVEAEGMVRKKGRKARRPGVGGSSGPTSGSATPIKPTARVANGGASPDVGASPASKKEGEEDAEAEDKEAAKPELSKKEKRRAKEAAKKAAGVSGAAAETCNVCGTGFQSRTKLFEHVKATRHELAVPDGGAKTAGRGGGAKRRGKG